MSIWSEVVQDRVKRRVFMNTDMYIRVT